MVDASMHVIDQKEDFGSVPGQDCDVVFNDTRPSICSNSRCVNQNHFLQDGFVQQFHVAPFEQFGLGTDAVRNVNKAL